MSDRISTPPSRIRRKARARSSVFSRTPARPFSRFRIPTPAADRDRARKRRTTWRSTIASRRASPTPPGPALETHLQKVAKSGSALHRRHPRQQRAGEERLRRPPRPVFSKALTDYPDNSFISYQLGQAYLCTVKQTPAKNDEVRPKAIYEFIRTLVIDPSLAGSQQDSKKITRAHQHLH